MSLELQPNTDVELLLVGGEEYQHVARRNCIREPPFAHAAKGCRIPLELPHADSELNRHRQQYACGGSDVQGGIIGSRNVADNALESLIDDPSGLTLTKTNDRGFLLRHRVCADQRLATTRHLKCEGGAFAKRLCFWVIAKAKTLTSRFCFSS
jgi:hypothetical protein